MHRKSLHAMVLQNRAKSSSEMLMSSSHTNYWYMSAPDLCSCLTLLHEEHCKTTLQLVRFREKVAIYCEEDNGMEVDAETHDDLKSIVVNNSASVVGSYPPDPLERLFWEQQEQAASVKNARAMRWYPLMIRWCLYLGHIFGKAYEEMHRSGFLKTYIEGLHLFYDAKLRNCAEYEKCVILVIDEVHNKED